MIKMQINHGIVQCHDNKVLHLFLYSLPTSFMKTSTYLWAAVSKGKRALAITHHKTQANIPEWKYQLSDNISWSIPRLDCLTCKIHVWQKSQAMPLKALLCRFGHLKWNITVTIQYIFWLVLVSSLVFLLCAVAHKWLYYFCFTTFRFNGRCDILAHLFWKICFEVAMAFKIAFCSNLQVLLYSQQTTVKYFFSRLWKLLFQEEKKNRLPISVFCACACMYMDMHVYIYI